MPHAVHDPVTAAKIRAMQADRIAAIRAAVIATAETSVVWAQMLLEASFRNRPCFICGLRADCPHREVDVEWALIEAAARARKTRAAAGSEEAA